MNSTLKEARATLAFEDNTLRAAINYGNPVLAQRGLNGEPAGVSVALAQALSKELGLKLQVVPFNAAGNVVKNCTSDVWDIAFLAIDPLRAEEIAFTEPYVIIEGTYLVNHDSPYQSLNDLDQPGTSIAVGEGAAYDLFLTRSLRNASLVRAPSSALAIDWFIQKRADAAAGVRQPLEKAATEHPNLRVIPGAFTSIRQAMATPLKNQAAIPFLQDFVNRSKMSGLVASALAASGQESATVAPAV